MPMITQHVERCAFDAARFTDGNGLPVTCEECTRPLMAREDCVVNDGRKTLVIWHAACWTRNVGHFQSEARYAVEMLRRLGVDASDTGGDITITPMVVSVGAEVAP